MSASSRILSAMSTSSDARTSGAKDTPGTTIVLSVDGSGQSKAIVCGGALFDGDGKRTGYLKQDVLAEISGTAARLGIPRSFEDDSVASLAHATPLAVSRHLLKQYKEARDQCSILWQHRDDYLLSTLGQDLPARKWTFVSRQGEEAQSQAPTDSDADPDPSIRRRPTIQSGSLHTPKDWVSIEASTGVPLTTEEWAFGDQARQAVNMFGDGQGSYNDNRPQSGEPSMRYWDMYQRILKDPDLPYGFANAGPKQTSIHTMLPFEFRSIAATADGSDDSEGASDGDEAALAAYLAQGTRALKERLGLLQR